MTATDPLLRALAHPVRLRIVSLVWNAPLSAAELARELGVSHALASQHLRRLDAVGLVELAEVRANRGGRERRYRAVHGSPLSDQRDEGALLIAEALAHNLRDRAGRRAPGAAGVTSDAELWVAPEVWDTFRVRLAALFDELHDAARAPHSPGTVGIGATVMAFPLTEPDAGPGPAQPDHKHEPARERDHDEHQHQHQHQHDHAPAPVPEAAPATGHHPEAPRSEPER
ncbi:ArsR/SmtB family transcription factor [Streptomyces sp. NPDC093221]|uniref:ArsR/SmtB family transcription factor n=1 Tax=Streptomyces sp. NPDC093221 TaxID=3366032 RepID=UPI0038283B0D